MFGRWTSFSLPFFALTAGLGAQSGSAPTDALLRAYAARPDLVLQVSFDAPAALPARFEGTNVGGLLEFEPIEKLIGDVGSLLADEERTDEQNELRDLRLAYRGRITLSLFWGDPAKGQTESILHVLARPDGETDLERAVELFESTDLESVEGITNEFVELAGREVRLARFAEHDGWVTLGAHLLDDGSLAYMSVTGATEDVGDTLAELLEAYDALERAGEGGTTTTEDLPIAQLRVSPAAFLRARRSLITAGVGAEFLEFIGSLVGVVGLDRVESIGAKLDTVDEFTRLRVNVESAAVEGQPSFLERLDPVGDGKVGMNRLAPRREGSWTTVRLDLAGVARTLFGEWVEDEKVGEQALRWQDQVRTNAGFDPIDELLPALGSEWLFVLPFEGVSPQAMQFNPLAFLDGFLLGISLRDRAALEECLTTALKKTGMSAARQTNEYRSFDTHTIPIGGLIPMHYALTDQALLLSFGRQGAEAVRAALDQVADARDGKEPPAFGEAIQTRLDAATPGWRSLGTGEIELSSIARGLARDAAGGPISEVLDEIAEGIDDELRRLGLDRVVQVGHRQPGRTMFEVIW